MLFSFSQVWNYETLNLAFIVGLEDDFDTGVASVAFSETSQSGYSLLGAIERGKEGVSYLHVWYGIEKGKPQKIGKEIASQTDHVCIISLLVNQIYSLRKVFIRFKECLIVMNINFRLLPFISILVGKMFLFPRARAMSMFGL